MPVMKTVDVVTANEWILKNEAVVVDVREPSEYVSMHIAGAKLIPVGTIDIDALPELNNKKLIVHCQLGGRSRMACEKLLDGNPNLDVYNLEGGIAAWEKAGFQLQKMDDASLVIKSFFDPDTATVTYVISDSSTQCCAIIDSVRNFDIYSGRLTSVSADNVVDYIKQMKLKVEWILETHIHADHLTAASYLKEKLGGKIGIGENIKKVLSHWVPIFNTASDTPIDGSQFDVLFSDGMQFKIGNLNVTVLHTPGHTPDSVSYHIHDAIFVGDTIFMPYVGTARADFPGGSSEDLYHSIQKILSLPDETRIYTCHDYPPAGQDPAWESTVANQKKQNVMIHEPITQSEFVSARHEKDANKPVPKLLLPSIQVNLRAGRLGSAENNGLRYIKIPVNRA